MGLSGMVFATTQQVALAFNGGLDTIAIRHIAADRSRCHPTMQAVLWFRIVVGVIAACVWLAVSLFGNTGGRGGVWALGAPLLLFQAASVAVAFQAMEKLPIQNAINAGGSLLMAACFFAFFSPGMKAGADLVVTGGALLGTAIASHFAYRAMTRKWAWTPRDPRAAVPFLKESWPYWLLSALVFYYTLFQIPLVNHFLGYEQAGLYRTAYGLAAGVEVLFNSVNALLLPRLCVWREQGLPYLWRRQKELSGIFIVIAVPPIFLLVCFARPLLLHLLGQAFEGSIDVFRVLVIGRLIVFVSQIYAYGLAAARRDRDFLLITAAGCGVSLVLSSLLMLRIGVVGAAAGAVTAEAVMCGLSVTFSWRALSREAVMANARTAGEFASSCGGSGAA
jgi:O-antigen/teichoic acid export membrane protein